MPDFIDMPFGPHLKHMLTYKRVINTSAIDMDNCYLKRADMVYSVNEVYCLLIFIFSILSYIYTYL